MLVRRTRSDSDHERTEGVDKVWFVQHAKSEDNLRVRLYEVLHDTSHDLGIDPGLQKDGVGGPARNCWLSTSPLSATDTP